MRQNQRFGISKIGADDDGLSPTSVEKRGAFSPQSNVDLTALIRSIQRTEGHVDCFRGGKGHCDQLGCAWRSYCLLFQDDAQQKFSK